MPPIKRTYFKPAELRWMFLVVSGLGILLWSWLSPLTIPGPYGIYLGPLGCLGRYLGVHFPGIVTAIVCIAGLLHVGEAVYAVKLCRANNFTVATTLKWFSSTLLFGVASLSILITYLRTTKRL